MKLIATLLALVLIATPILAQQSKDDVVEMKKAPTTSTITVVCKGKVIGQYIKIEHFQQAQQANQRMGEFIKGLSIAGLQLVEPGLYSVLMDTNKVFVDKRSLKPMPAAVDTSKKEPKK